MKDQSPLFEYKRYQIVASLAGLLWLFSLPFAAFTTAGGKGVYSGGVIFLFGWLGPLMGNVGWFANILFFIGLRRQIFGLKIPTLVAGYAFLLSLSSFTLSEIPVFNSTPTSVWGFGLGFVLWMLSILLLLVSVGLRTLDGDDEMESNPPNQRYPWGSILLLFTFCLIVLGKGGTDRIFGNNDERIRLSENMTVFKRRPICSVEPATVNHQVSAKSPIELIESGINASSRISMVEDLLRSGIPTVRFGGFDFYYSSFDEQNLLTAEIAKGEPAAILYRSVYKTQWQGHSGLRQKLLDFSDKSIVFEQTWEQEYRNGPNCPRTKTRYSEYKPPKQLVLDSLLDLTGDIKVEKKPLTTQLNGVISSSFLIENKTIVEQRNAECPANVSWVNMPEFPKNLGLHFRSGDKYFFPGNYWRGAYDLQCNDKTVYLNKVHKKKNKDRTQKLVIEVHKHSLKNFYSEWKINVEVTDVKFELTSIKPKLIVTELNAKQLLLTVVDRDSDYVHEIIVDLTKE